MRLRPTARHRASTHSAIATVGCRTPTFKWAERLDKVFLTILVPEMSDVSVSLGAEGRVQFAAVNGHDGLRYTLDIKLFGPIDKESSKWFVHRDKVDLTLYKGKSKVRWFQLLEGTKAHPQMQVDWSKYKDYDEELDELEIKSGVRGIPVPKGDRELTHAVEDYWKRKRVEERESNKLPDLDAVTKAAEKEWNEGGKKGSYQDIVQRRWKEANDLRKREQQLDREEDEWAGWVKPAAKDEA